MPKPKSENFAAPDVSVATTAVVLRALLVQVGDLAVSLKQAFVGVARPSGKMKWASHVPTLSRAIADMIDADPRLFAWLPFDAATLRLFEGEVLLLSEVKSVLDRLAAYVNDVFLTRRHQLYEMTVQATEGVELILKSPMTAADLRPRIEELSQAVRAIVEERNTQIRSARRDNKKRAECAQADIDRLTEENQILRGDQNLRADPKDAPSRPKTAKRARR